MGLPLPVGAGRVRKIQKLPRKIQKFSIFLKIFIFREQTTILVYFGHGDYENYI